ncbi:MAG: tetratricopeptide repeat protein [Syntrophorhabdaceae bacterium]|nr:tetratricopeptide repeat protein [Syntrophorhabdaceae bacterium]
MRKTIYTGITIISLLLFVGACATLTQYQIYSYDMLFGKDFLKDKKYTDARKYFQDASALYKDSAALTYLAVVEYKMGNTEGALKHLQEAEKAGTDQVLYLRILGYKTLMLFKTDREKGTAALRDYVNYYQHQYPLMSIKDVREMLQTGQVDTKRLEELIDEQVSTYEQEIDQFLSDGTGFYDRHGSRPVH